MSTLKKPEDFTPYPWQVQLASRLKRDHALSVQALPGAGKTSGALLSAVLANCQRVLVVAPPGAVCAQWVREAALWGYRAMLIGGKGCGGAKLSEQIILADALDGPLCMVLPWSRVQRTVDATAVLEALTECGPANLLIVDESHYAQTAKSARHKGCMGYWDGRRKLAVKGLRHHARMCLGLTGTPVTSDPRKIRAQLLLAHVDRDRSAKLNTQYTYEGKWWGGRMQYDYGARRELWQTEDQPAPGHEELVRKGILRVSEDDLRRQLPANRREMLATMTAGAVPDTVTVWADAQEAGRPAALPALEDLADMRREATEARADELAELAAGFHREEAAGRVLIVWCQYQASAEYLAARIGAELGRVPGDLLADPKAESRAVSLHGGKTASMREGLLSAAKAGAVRVLVVTSASTGTGVDGLQHTSNHQIVAEAPWTPGEAEQLEGRIVRTGQALPVHTRWVASGIEGAIVRGIGYKAEAIGETLAGADVLRLNGEDASERPEPEEVEGGLIGENELETEREQVDPTALSWGWAKDNRTGDWLARVPFDSEGQAWAGAVVELVTRAGKRTKVALGARQCGGDDWSLWSFEKVQDERAESRRRVAYLAKRAALRGIDAPDSPLTEAERVQAGACWDAAHDLTAMDADCATEKNGAGWNQADGTIGRNLCASHPDDWDAGTLMLAKAVLHKYSRTQIQPTLVPVIWPEKGGAK